MATKKAKKSIKKTTTTKKPVAKITTVKAISTAKKNVAPSWKDKLQSYRTPNIKNGQLVASLVAEFIGTFMFVAFFMGTQGDPRYALYALAGIVLIIGGISGAYINPAMTVSAWITRKINSSRAIGYLIAQILGGVAAWSVLTAYVKGTAVTVASQYATDPTVFTATAVTAGKEWYVFFGEVIGAAILAFGLAAALKAKKNKEPIIGGALGYAFALYIAMFITYIIVSPLGTGLVFFNPSVAFAASAVTWKLWPIAIYVIAPIIGGIIGFVLVDILHSQIEISLKEEK